MRNTTEKISLNCPNGFLSYWRDLCKEPLYFSERNFGNGSLMVGGAFASTGVPQLAFPRSRMITVEDISALLPLVGENYGVQWTFQLGNTAIHTSLEQRSG